jgi:hypothetical protein
MAMDERPDASRPAQYEPPPMWDGPLFHGKVVDPNPNPPPVYSRRDGGATSFGYRGRMVMTILIAPLALGGAALCVVGGPFGLVFGPVALLISWLLLRSIWKRVRVS